MKKHNSKNFIVDLVVYPFDIMFSFGETDAQIIKRLNKLGIDHNANDWQFESDSTRGRTCVFSSGQTLIRMPQIPKICTEYGTLSHEIFHAVEFLFRRINIKHCLGTSESFAYLIGYITTKVYEKL